MGVDRSFLLWAPGENYIPSKIKLTACDQQERRRSFLSISLGIISRLGEHMAAGWHQITTVRDGRLGQADHGG